MKNIGVKGEWIWGDDNESLVFAQAFGNSRTLIFQFEADESTPCGLPHRIVNCYHCIETDDANKSFKDRSAMRTSLWPAVASIWEACIASPETLGPDIVIHVYDHGECISWKAQHDTRFDSYLESLWPADRLCLQQPTDAIDFSRLVRLNPLGGRGCSTLVINDSEPQSHFVFKGIDFRTYVYGYESGLIMEDVKTFYHSVQLIDKMPRHPNIKLPAPTLVTIRRATDNIDVVCGTLEPFSPNGTLADKIETSNADGRRIPLRQKALWCRQMAAAVAHTHLVVHTYHMDIKPGNFLVDLNNNLVLIDWEQNDAPMTTAAPEIDGTWDVEQSTDGSLVYSKYTGPERRNMPEATPGQNGWNIWNVFPLWIEHCPKAAELAEVFSVGRSMWMLLRQPDMDFELIKNTRGLVEDWDGCDDIPESWKDIVNKCIERDPNKRIRLDELALFWDKAVQTMK